jgi:hypothetical protein
MPLSAVSEERLFTIRMATMDSSTAALFLLLPSVPLVLVYAAGIIAALLNMVAYRKASTFALTGFIGLLLTVLIRGTATLMTLPEFHGNMPINELSIRIGTINILATLLTVAAMVLLIVAIFTDRDRQPQGFIGAVGRGGD